MKILYINSHYIYGSTGRLIHDLMNEAKEEGHQVLCVYGREEQEDKKDTFYIGDKSSQSIHGLMTRIFGRHGLHSTTQTKNLLKKIEEFNPDIIHLHNLHGYYLNVPLLLDYLSEMDIPIYLTLHDTWLISGSSASFDYHGCKVWEDGCIKCNNPREYPKSYGFKREKKNFNWKKEKISKLNNLKIITPSFWLENLIKRSYLSRFPIKTIHNGVDTNIFKRYENEENTEKKELLMVVNSWDQRKGMKDFFELSNILDDSFTFTLIAPRNEKIQIPEKINHIERIDDPIELAKRYGSAFCLVNPTYEDNYPTVNLESLACRTPVVAYDTGGVKEAGKEPYLNVVEKGDILRLKNKIESLTKLKGNFDIKNVDKEVSIRATLEYYNLKDEIFVNKLSGKK